MNAHKQKPPLPQYLVESALICNDPGLTALVLKTGDDYGYDVDVNQRQTLNSIIAQQQRPAQTPQHTPSWLAMVAN